MPINMQDGTVRLNEVEKSELWQTVKEEAAVRFEIPVEDVRFNTHRQAYEWASRKYDALKTRRELELTQQRQLEQHALVGREWGVPIPEEQREGARDWVEWTARDLAAALPVELGARRPVRRGVPLPAKARRAKIEVKGQSTVLDVFHLGDPRSSPNDAAEKRAKLSMPEREKDMPFDGFTGVEIEVENVLIPPTAANDTAFQNAWDHKGDGSLRNGAEYVTKFGMRASECIGAVRKLDAYFDQGAASAGEARVNSMTFRCGLHVHVDVTEHTLEQLYRILLIYPVMEYLFFAVSGERDKLNSIKYCVPAQTSVNSTQAALYYGHQGNWSKFVDAIYHGSKYMAMNIRTIKRFGTLEFRHHEGTSNPEVIKRWMMALLDLCYASRDFPIKEVEEDIFNLNTISQYEEFVRKYFPNSAELFCKVCNQAKLMYSGAAYVKEALLTDPELELFEMERD